MTDWTPTPAGTTCSKCGVLIVGESCRCGVRGPVGIERLDLSECGEIARPERADRLIELQIQMEAAHSACDSSWRRSASLSGKPYTLAERINGMRQMIDDYERWLAESEARNAFVPPDDSTWRIACFFAGAMIGVFLVWGFLSLQ